MTAVSGERLISQLVAYVEHNREKLSDGSSELALNPTCLRYLTRLDALLNLDNSDSVRLHLTPLRQRECRALLLYLGTLKLLRIVPTHDGAVDKLIEFELRAFRSLVAVEIRSIKLGLVGDWRRLACQLRLVIVHDCLNSLDELLDVSAGTVNSTGNGNAAESASTNDDVDDADDSKTPASGEPWSQLQQLSCAENFIPRMDASLHALTRLERLDLSHNVISRIENTENCYNLAYLNLGFNRIESVSSINLVLGNLSVLILRDNNISSMLGLEKLFNLRRLDLSNNRLSDLTELRELGTLPTLDQLWLVRNPLTAASGYRSAVFCAFQQDLVLDGRSPTDTERRERSEERVLRAAARERSSSNPEARSVPVVVARRKHPHTRQRVARKPAIAAVASESSQSLPISTSPRSIGLSDEHPDSGAASSEVSPSVPRRSTGAFDITLESLDQLASSPLNSDAGAYLQELRKQGGAAWLLMMEELSSGGIPDTPQARNALLSRIQAKTNAGSLSRIIAPKINTAVLAAASLGEQSASTNATVASSQSQSLSPRPANTASAPVSPRDATSDGGSATDSNSPTLSRYSSMPPGSTRPRSVAMLTPTAPAAQNASYVPAVAATAPLPTMSAMSSAMASARTTTTATTKPAVTLTDLAAIENEASARADENGGALLVLGVAQLEESVLSSLTALLRKDGDVGDIRCVLRTNGLIGKSDDEQRLHIALTSQSFSVFRGEPPSLHLRDSLSALNSLRVSLSHQYCVLRCASGDTFTLLFRDPTLAARWLKQLAQSTTRIGHTIDGESSAPETATLLQREVVGDGLASDPVKLYVLLYRVVPGAKRYAGYLPDVVRDTSLQPTTLVVSRQWLALCIDGFGPGPFSDVVRFEVSDITSLVLDQHSYGFTIVFDEQAEPMPKKDKRTWRRTAATHRWSLITQSADERDKTVSVIAKMWKAIFKIDLVQM